MTKEGIIKEAKDWMEKNMPDKELTSGMFESLHASGQENLAIWTADDNMVIQENSINDKSSNSYKETEYSAD